MAPLKVVDPGTQSICGIQAPESIRMSYGDDNIDNQQLVGPREKCGNDRNMRLGFLGM